MENTPELPTPRECRHCTHSLSQLVGDKPQLICMRWRRLAHQACSEWERTPGVDDDV